jgi:hypothetical protein
VEISLMVNPLNRTVTLYQAGVSTCELRGCDRIDLDRVLPGFELTVEDLFGALGLR